MCVVVPVALPTRVAKASIDSAEAVGPIRVAELRTAATTDFLMKLSTLIPIADCTPARGARGQRVLRVDLAPCTFKSRAGWFELSVARDFGCLAPHFDRCNSPPWMDGSRLRCRF